MPEPANFGIPLPFCKCLRFRDLGGGAGLSNKIATYHNVINLATLTRFLSIFLPKMRKSSCPYLWALGSGLRRIWGPETTKTMPSTHKKVVVRKMDRDSINGYVGASFVLDGKLEMMNTAGNVVLIPLGDVKGVFFVREFGDSESLIRKTFTTRPRSEGLWVRLKFRDNDTIEGMLPNNLAQISPEGFLINPPDLRSNTQRIFVPRSALSELTVLAVIGGAGQRRRKGATASDERQEQLFEE